MSWTKILELFVNTDKTVNCLVTGSTSTNQASNPSFILGDKFPVRLRFVEPSDVQGASPRVVELPAGSQIVLAGKKKGALSEASTLFAANTFIKTGEGESAYYECELELNTDDLATALGTDDSIDVVIDVEIENADNSDRMTKQFEAKVYPQVYSDEGDPVAGDPSYPAAGAVMLREPANGNYRAKNGASDCQLQIYNQTSGKFHSIWITGADPNFTLHIGPEET